mgnify:CR=1 FL=1
MKAVKCKNGIVTLISSDEARLFNKIDMANFVDLNTLSERECHLAEELYKRNVLNKVKREHKIGYKIHPQKQKI